VPLGGQPKLGLDVGAAQLAVDGDAQPVRRSVEGVAGVEAFDVLAGRIRAAIERLGNPNLRYVA